VALASGLVFGAAPALVRRRDHGSSAQEGARHVTARSRLQQGLVASQVAFALVLLAGAGLLARTLLSLWQVDPGFRRDGLLTFRIEAPDSRYPGDSDVLEFHRSLAERLEALPGVLEVAATSVLPLSGETASNSIWPASYGPESGPKPEVERRIVSPGYLASLAIPVRRGRGFTERDDATAELVMLVSERAAATLWEGREPIGDRVELSNRWWRVVGVVSDIHDRSLSGDPLPTVYVASPQWPSRARVVTLRSTGPPAALIASVRATVRSQDPDVPVTQVQTMEHLIARSMAGERFRARLVGGFATAALLLAVIGLYGVTAHGVARRTRELGIRMALGATRRAVARLVLRQAGRMVAIGLGAGLALAIPATRLLRSVLFGVEPFDLPSFAAAGAMLALTALLAALAPASRAGRVDPVEALRHE
jgi:putative ABC transport system permease protein